jgi:hypothetical protein
MNAAIDDRPQPRLAAGSRGLAAQSRKWLPKKKVARAKAPRPQVGAAVLGLEIATAGPAACLASMAVAIFGAGEQLAPLSTLGPPRACHGLRRYGRARCRQFGKQLSRLLHS